MSSVRSRLFLVALLLASCSQENTVKEEFSLQVSCPVEKVTVTPRTDVTYTQVAILKSEPKAPPSEIQNDPARLQVRQEKEKKDQAAYDDMNALFNVFHVSGCGEKAFYACKKGVSNNCFKVTNPNKVE